MKNLKNTKIKFQSKTLFTFKKRNQLDGFQTSATCPPTTDTTTVTATTVTGIMGY